MSRVDNNIVICRCFAHNLSGQIVKNKKNGLLVSQNDSLELSKAILYLYKNKNKAKKFANEGFRTVKNKFSLKKTINEHEKEYLKCLRSWHKKM